MKKLVSFFLFIVALAITAMFGFISREPAMTEVMRVLPGTVQYGVQSALIAQPGTVIMENGGRYLFGWTMESGFAFVGMDPVKQMSLTIDGGNLINVKNAKDFVNTMASGGWKVVTASQVPEVVKLAAGAAKTSRIAAWFSTMSTTTVVLIFPKNQVDGQYWKLIYPEVIN
jgi:hypothetical protein